MAVIDVTEQGERRTVDEEEKSITAVRIFTVEFDNADDPAKRPLLARNASDGTTTVPYRHQVHPYNNWLYVKSKHVETKGPFLYEVRVNYESFTDPSSSEPAPISPLLQPPEVSWNFVTSNEPIDRDIYGKPITNSAKEAFDPPITRDFDDLVLRVVRNEAEFNALRAAEYKGAVNSDMFLGFAAGVVRCVLYNGVKQYAAGLVYWKVTYEFHIRWNGWQRKIQDMGFSKLNATEDDYEPIKIKDDKGIETQVSQPWPLDLAGHALTPAQKKAGVAYWLIFNIYPQKPFFVLGL